MLALRRCGHAPQPGARSLPRPAFAGEADHRFGAVMRDNGEIEVFTGISRAAQHVPRPGEGRHPLRPERVARRSQGARGVDDLEVRGRQPAVRRRQGRCHLRSIDDVGSRIERLTRRYTSAIIETLGPESDVPAPDVNTNERVMAWIMDTYSMHKRHTVTGVVTGKPVEMGGSLGRRDATGRGCLRRHAVCARAPR